MRTSVLRCPKCRYYYAEFFKDKRSMKFLARLHKESHQDDDTETDVRSDTQKRESLGH